MKNKKIKIGIICPCDIEYQVCKEILKLGNETKIAGRLIAERKEKHREVRAVKAGVGKINCSSATQLIIDKFYPDFIFDVGAAGSLIKDLNIYDIVLGEYSFEYDASTGEKLDTVPTEDNTTWTALKKSSCKEILKEFSNKVRDNMGIDIKFGNIACGEKDVRDTKLKQNLREKLKAIACNWETSSVLKTAQFHGIESFSFRIITDLSDENIKNDLHANWEKALKILFLVVHEFIFQNWVYSCMKNN